MLYAEQLVKIHLLIQKAYSLNRGEMGGETELVICTLSRQQHGQVQKPAQACVLHTGP